ncbi:hypothetical protein HY085_02530 [Candidatus Gottesmanbacteria bacterium]|nr:hypothetical protein [Candidatus Gottesmanbacteria bacterium]
MILSRYDRRTKRQTIFFLLLSLALLVLLFVYGLPALLNLTGLISNYKRSSVAIIKKGTPPATPRLSEDLTATSSAKVKISGVADPKMTVELFQNSESQGTMVTKDDGTFSFEVNLNPGENSFTVQAVNDSGEKSSLSAEYEISFLKNPPKLEAFAANDGTVTGTTDPGTTVSINDRLTIVDSRGKFSYQLNLKDGENKITVVATDPAGNQTKKELTATKATP